MYRFQVTQQEVNMCPSSSKDWHKKRYVAKEPPPQARRATTKAEFCLMQTLLKDEEVSFEAKYGIRAFNNYQFHMIGRVDDCTQLQLESVQSNQNFPSFAIKTKLNWSKNVLEERDSPWQVVFGGNNPLYCTLTSLALWLEIMIALPYGHTTPYVFALNVDVRVPEGSKRSKEMIQRFLCENIFA